MTWREHKTDPAPLREVNGIYSVYFLHAVHINTCRYAAHIRFHFALVFLENISRSPSLNAPEEAINTKKQACIHH